MTSSDPQTDNHRRPGPSAQSARSAGRPSAWLRCSGRLTLLYLACLLIAGSYGLTLLLPSLVKATGGSPDQAGLIYWCGALGAGGALVLSGQLTQRIGTGWAAAAGSVLYALATAVLAADGAVSGIAYVAGVLLGAGWALCFTCSPILASSLPGPATPGRRFVVLAGFNAVGMGAGPIAGELLETRGVSFQTMFVLAALLSLGSAVLLGLLAKLTRPGPAEARIGTACGFIGAARLILTYRTRPFLLMVALGACVFTTMTTYQAPLAASKALNPSVFYACYTLGVIIPRFTVAGLLTRSSPARPTTVLLAGMCLSLVGFLLTGHNPALYAISSALLGITYGLAYPLIQARAADSAPARLRHWALWYFSLAYFAGIYGFPLLAATVIILGGYQALIAALLAIAALELAVSVKTQRPLARVAPLRDLATDAGRTE